MRATRSGGTSEAIANVLATSLTTVVDTEAKALAKLRELAKTDPSVAEWIEVMLETMARRDAA